MSELEKTERVKELISLGMDLNETKTGCCFVGLRGHVSSFEIQIVNSKEDYKNWIHEFHFYLDDEFFDYEKSRKALKALKAAIKKHSK